MRLSFYCVSYRESNNEDNACNSLCISNIIAVPTPSQFRSIYSACWISGDRIPQLTYK